MNALPLDPHSVNRDVNLLCPTFLLHVQDALIECRMKGLTCDIFEGYRTPQRQAWLYSKGRFGDSVNRVVTNAQEWQSWHNYSLAVDIVFKDAVGNWTWNGNYDQVEEIFVRHKLEKGPRFEHAHFELTGGVDLGFAKGLSQTVGTPRVWQEVLIATAKLA